MKVFTNKYPIHAGFIEINEDGTVKKDSIKTEVVEGKVFKLIAISFDSVLLESSGKVISISVNTFNIAFTETEIDV